jgi:hypothetical protein
MPIDYTNLGYQSLRDAMLAMARERLPEWTDLSESDLGVMLVEQFAYACDITLYYQTRIAANLMPATADEPDALVQLLRILGYELLPPSPASADLRLAFDAGVLTPITVPAGTRFNVTLPSGGDPVTYETQGEVIIQASHLTPPDIAGRRYFFPLTVIEGQTVSGEVLGQSDGSPNQQYALQQKPVIAGSVRIQVAEPAGTTVWRRVDTLATSNAVERNFVEQRDAESGVTVLFGDNANGMAPPRGSLVTPVTITADYRILRGGPRGNVLAGTRFIPAAALPGNVNILEAVNPQAAAGASPGEDPDRARRFAPRLYRTQERAVTTDDYTDLALQVAGVGKARAVAVNWNQVALYVAPSGWVAEPSDLLKRDILAFFESRRMATATLKIAGPRPVDVYLRADVRAQPYFLPSDVNAAVQAAVAAYLDFDAVDFGQPIYLSRIYDAIQSLPQVASVNVTQFSRSPAGTIDTGGTIEAAPHELPRPGYRDNPDTPANPLDPGFRPSIVATILGGASA